MAPRALRDPRIVARAGFALGLANARYWVSVAPIVRRELKRWELHAQAIDDPELRALALEKLDGEGFHAEAAAMLATFAPRAHRGDVIEAIVALELLFDYLDGLTERPSPDPLADGERLFRTFIDAVALGSTDAVENLEIAAGQDGYLELLSRAVLVAVTRLPGAAAITDVARHTAEWGAQAQIRMHAAPELGLAQLEDWAAAESNGSGLGWREFAAGAASSVLVLHALIAAAADARTTSQDVDDLAGTYLSICVLLTLLDGLVDYEQDRDNGPSGPGYLGLYADREELLEVLGDAARRAALHASQLAHGAHHVMILVGVVAYYGSAPGAENAVAKPVVARLQRELAPLAPPTLRIMRAWRTARRRTRVHRHAGAAAPELNRSGRAGCEEPRERDRPTDVATAWHRAAGLTATAPLERNCHPANVFWRAWTVHDPDSR